MLSILLYREEIETEVESFYSQIPEDILPS
jgi:hypothetical protein